MREAEELGSLVGNRDNNEEAIKYINEREKRILVDGMHVVINTVP